MFAIETTETIRNGQTFWFAHIFYDGEYKSTSKFETSEERGKFISAFVQNMPTS